MKQKITNWFIKQLFYIKYFILKKSNVYDYYYSDLTFESNNFIDGKWNKYLPWYSGDEWPFQDWNTYNIFSQKHGRFYFRAKLNGLVTDSTHPAIWLYESKSWNDCDINLGEHPYYYEIDVELLKGDLTYTIHVNHNGGQYAIGYYVVFSKFRNKRLYRNLQKNYHLFMIEWDENWIKYYINGILSAKFKNDVLMPMQMIMSNCEMNLVFVK